MKYVEPEMIQIDATSGVGLCNDGSTASDDLAKCAVGGIYTDVSCHSGDTDGTGGCFNGSLATGLNCAYGGSATAGNFASCNVGGDYQ